VCDRRFCARREFSPDDAAGAGSIIDDHLLAERGAQRIGHEPSREIDEPPGENGTIKRTTFVG